MRVLCGFLFLLLVPGLCAQGIEDVIVETYAVAPGRNGSPDTTTYRIYLDLAPGHRLQMVYGDERHQLLLGSDADFVNDTVSGGKFADELDPGILNDGKAARDTWLTIGRASMVHAGVPRALDPDGSILTCPPYPPHDRSPAHAGAPSLCTVDGLVPDTVRNDIVDFRFASGYLHRVRGSLLETTDGAWAALGGYRGATEENIVLIAQVTTTGRLYFRLNAQVADAEGTPVKHVWAAPSGSEVLCPQLSRGKVR
jgi:hypothetical protein